MQSVDFAQKPDAQNASISQAQVIERRLALTGHLCKAMVTRRWLNEDSARAAICVQTSISHQRVSDYTVFRPSENIRDVNPLEDDGFRQAAAWCRSEFMMIMSNSTIEELIRHNPSWTTFIPLDINTNVQILDTIVAIQHAKKLQHAAFIRDLRVLLVWGEFSEMMPRANKLQNLMVDHIWSSKEKRLLVSEYSVSECDSASDCEASISLPTVSSRPVRVLTPVMVCASMVLGFCLLGLGVKALLRDVFLSGNFMKIGLLLTLPITFLFASFFCLVVVGIPFQLLGPITHIWENSSTYSGIRPARTLLAEDLPQITIQMPVYKEDLEDVIIPTIRSVRAAISTYELQGGSANIFINDDGMAVINEAEAERRKAFYATNEIGWTARPPHGKDGFVRPGKFKKASNMNFALHISTCLEEELERIDRTPQWTPADEELVYKQCLDKVLEAAAPGTEAAGQLRVGDLILLIDSDTRVPTDCFLDAANEFAQSPEVAILQHVSGVLQVTHDFWEDAFAFFTRNIYLAIRFAVAGGDAAPFVGHNAFLRWSAIQEIEVIEDGQRKWWSDKHVSEDFEMALKLQMKMYKSRLASYSEGMFKEGVSLTVYDELARWEKYAFGCSELLFNPFKYWWRHGPFSPMFWSFLRSNIHPVTKYTMIAYMATYFSIAASLPLTIFNYLYVGLWPGPIISFYETSFSVYLCLIFVFSIWQPFVLSISRYRAREKTFFAALLENYKWVVLFTIFFSGLSGHLAKALLFHLLDIEISWGATAKSLEATSFSEEIPRIWKKYRVMYALICAVALCMLVFAYLAPWQFRIRGFSTTLPLAWLLVCHATVPILFNSQSYFSELHI